MFTSRIRDRAKPQAPEFRKRLLRLGLLCVAAATLGGVFLSSRRPSGHRLAATLTGTAFCIVLVSELCGRFLFYAMQVRVGI